ncbi:MAG: site-specific integrase [Sulfurimonas sp.]|uniref:site-specific integrase n=1 Tax=Sulfurimonas sp. TaxID=2022749 RepID=UPI0025DD16CD|nr:site-specific integrase [Sulfurimonas sp.]MCK9491631.1 site-specific integrase [Sulfurimonas sp.]
MRVGEILGLQLGDFKNGYIHIKRTRTKGIIGTGKTINSRRVVPYPKYILSEIKKIQTNNIFIFGNIDDADKLKKRWAKVVKDSGVVRHKLSSTRHTFATLMLKDNIVSINELSGLLGHNKASTTLEYYASIIESKNIDLGVNFSLFDDDNRLQNGDSKRLINYKAQKQVNLGVRTKLTKSLVLTHSISFFFNKQIIKYFHN